MMTPWKRFQSFCRRFIVKNGVPVLLSLDDLERTKLQALDTSLAREDSAEIRRYVDWCWSVRLLVRKAMLDFNISVNEFARRWPHGDLAKTYWPRAEANTRSRLNGCKTKHEGELVGWDWKHKRVHELVDDCEEVLALRTKQRCRRCNFRPVWSGKYNEPHAWTCPDCGLCAPPGDKLKTLKQWNKLNGADFGQMFQAKKDCAMMAKRASAFVEDFKIQYGLERPGVAPAPIKELGLWLYKQAYGKLPSKGQPTCRFCGTAPEHVQDWVLHKLVCPKCGCGTGTCYSQEAAENVWGLMQGAM